MYGAAPVNVFFEPTLTVGQAKAEKAADAFDRDTHTREYGMAEEMLGDMVASVDAIDSLALKAWWR